MDVNAVAVAQDGKRISESPRWKLIAEEDHYTLLIYEVRPEDAGKYDCMLSNKHGKTACSARLNVVGKNCSPDQRRVQTAGIFLLAAAKSARKTAEPAEF